MSQLPRNQRHKARLKRNVSILSRSLRNLQQQFGQTQTMLLAVLAQSGGEVTITTGTLNQVLPKLATLGWQVMTNPLVPGESLVPGEFVVRLVSSGATDAEEQQAQDAAAEAAIPDVHLPNGSTLTFEGDASEPYVGTGIDIDVTDELADTPVEVQ